MAPVRPPRTNAPTQARNPYRPPHNSHELAHPTTASSSSSSSSSSFLSSTNPPTSTPAPATPIISPAPTRPRHSQPQLLLPNAPASTSTAPSHRAALFANTAHHPLNPAPPPAQPPPTPHPDISAAIADRFTHLSHMRSRRHRRDGTERHEGAAPRGVEKRTTMPPPPRQRRRELEAATRGGSSRPDASCGADALAESLSTLSTDGEGLERDVRGEDEEEEEEEESRCGEGEEVWAARREAEGSVRSGAEGMDGVVGGGEGPGSGDVTTDAQRTDSPLVMDREQDGWFTRIYPVRPPGQERAD